MRLKMMPVNGTRMSSSDVSRLVSSFKVGESVSYNADYPTAYSETWYLRKKLAKQNIHVAVVVDEDGSVKLARVR